MEYKNDPLIEALNKSRMEVKTFLLIAFLGGMVFGIIVANI